MHAVLLSNLRLHMFFVHLLRVVTEIIHRGTKVSRSKPALRIRGSKSDMERIPAMNRHPCTCGTRHSADSRHGRTTSQGNLRNSRPRTSCAQAASIHDRSN
jgi:hypothetical protein